MTPRVAGGVVGAAPGRTPAVRSPPRRRTCGSPCRGRSPAGSRRSGSRPGASSPCGRGSARASAPREAQDPVGNLGPGDAADLAAAAGARVAVPTHDEMFAATTGDPLALVAATATHDGLAALVPAHFAPVVLG